MVIDNLAPSDAALRQMWVESHKKGDDFSTEQCFVGVAFYNWFLADKRLDQKYTLNRNADEVADCFIEVLKSS